MSTDKLIEAQEVVKELKELSIAIEKTQELYKSNSYTVTVEFSEKTGAKTEEVLHAVEITGSDKQWLEDFVSYLIAKHDAQLKRLEALSQSGRIQPHELVAWEPNKMDKRVVDPKGA